MLLRYLNEVYRSLTRRGVIETVKVLVAVANDYVQDLRRGVNTASWLPAEKAGLDHHQLAGTRFYAPTTRLAFGQLMAQISPARGVFLDIGSGKGGVLLMAATLGLFDKVRGIEFSPVLNTIAKNNLHRIQPETPVELMEGDLREMDLRDDETLIYLYDPFDEALIRLLLERIEASLTRVPRTLRILYCNPVYAEIFDGSLRFTLEEEHRCWGFAFRLYRCTGFAPG